MLAELEGIEADPAKRPAGSRAAGSGSSTASSSSGSNDSLRLQGSSRKGSRGGSSGSSKQQMAPAGSSSEQLGSRWAIACSRAQQLPPLQQELLQALKCSGKVLLWAALSETASFQVVQPDVAGLAEAYIQVYEMEAQVAAAGSLGLAQQQTSALHALIPGVLLPWAAAQHRSDVDLVLSSATAGDATHLAVKAAYLRPALPGAFELCVDKLPRIIPDLLALQSRLLTASRSDSGGTRPSKVNGVLMELPVPHDPIMGACWALSDIIGMLAAPCRELQAVVPFTWFPARAQVSGGVVELETHTWQPYAADLMAGLESHVRLPNALKDFDTRVQSVPFISLVDRCAVGEQAQPNVLAATAIAAGFGSTEQQHLFCLLCSLLKCTSKLCTSQQTEAEECRW
jgi:hypothetical protein